MLGITRFVRDRGGVSLTVTLATSICALLLVAVTSVLVIGLWSGAKNTQILLQQQANLILSTTSEKVQTHLEPASNQARLLAQLIAAGALDPARRDKVSDTFRGGLVAAPQLDSVLFIDDTLQGIGVGRSESEIVEFSRDFSTDQSVRDAFAKAQAEGTTHWGEPIWLPRLKKTLLNYRPRATKASLSSTALVARLPALK